MRRGGRGGAGRGAGCAGCAARGRRRRGSSALPRRRGEGASRPPPLPPGIRFSAAGEARRPGSLARPRPRLSAARSPAAGPLAESGRGPGGELCARVDVRGLARRAGGRPGAPLTRPGPAPRRPARPERAPPAARGPRTSSLGAGPAACQVEGGGGGSPETPEEAIVGLGSPGNKFCGFLLPRRRVSGIRRRPARSV